MSSATNTQHVLETAVISEFREGTQQPLSGHLPHVIEQNFAEALRVSNMITRRQSLQKATSHRIVQDNLSRVSDPTAPGPARNWIAGVLGKAPSFCPDFSLNPYVDGQNLRWRFRFHPLRSVKMALTCASGTFGLSKFGEKIDHLRRARHRLITHAECPPADVPKDAEWRETPCQKALGCVCSQKGKALNMLNTAFNTVLKSVCKKGTPERKLLSESKLFVRLLAHRKPNPDVDGAPERYAQIWLHVAFM